MVMHEAVKDVLDERCTAKQGQQRDATATPTVLPPFTRGGGGGGLGPSLLYLLTSFLIWSHRQTLPLVSVVLG